MHELALIYLVQHLESTAADNCKDTVAAAASAQKVG